MDFKIRDDEEFIKLGQLLKASSLVYSGSDAKTVILNGEVKVNGEVCFMRGKKLHPGDIVFYKGSEVKIS